MERKCGCMISTVPHQRSGIFCPHMLRFDVFTTIISLSGHRNLSWKSVILNLKQQSKKRIWKRVQVNGYIYLLFLFFGLPFYWHRVKIRNFFSKFHIIGIWSFTARKKRSLHESNTGKARRIFELKTWANKWVDTITHWKALRCLILRNIIKLQKPKNVMSGKRSTQWRRREMRGAFSSENVNEISRWQNKQFPILKT